MYIHVYNYSRMYIYISRQDTKKDTFGDLMAEERERLRGQRGGRERAKKRARATARHRVGVRVCERARDRVGVSVC